MFQANIPRAAAFACAGPVAQNKCEMTNLSWIIDGDYLSYTHGIRYTNLSLRLVSSDPIWLAYSAKFAEEYLTGVCHQCRMAVLNDFEANGYGVTALEPHHVVTLNDVPPTEKVFTPALSCTGSMLCYSWIYKRRNNHVGFASGRILLARHWCLHSAWITATLRCAPRGH